MRHLVSAVSAFAVCAGVVLFWAGEANAAPPTDSLSTLTSRPTSASRSSSAPTSSFVPISGSASSDAQDQVRLLSRHAFEQEGITVSVGTDNGFPGSGDVKRGQADFAVSEIPFGLSDGGVLNPSPTRAFGYLPILAGGPAIIYNLKMNNQRVGS